MQDGVDDLAEGLALEGQTAGEHLVEHDAEREQVRTRIGGAAQRLLGRHVGDGPQHGADHRVGPHGERGVQRRPAGWRLQELGQPEVEHLHLAACGDDDVGALDVAMDDAPAVRFGQRVGHLPGDVHGLAHGERAMGDARREDLALDVLHHQEVGALVLADVVDGGDVGGPQRRGGPGLGQQARAPFRVRLAGRGQELERDLASQPRVFGEVDLAHAARAQALAHAIVLDGGADHSDDLSVATIAALSMASAAGESGQSGSGGAV